MSDQLEAAKSLITRCTRMRNEHRSEAVLRAEFSSWLRSMFPDGNDASWVNHYTEGTEAGTRIGFESGQSHHRFIDNLVRATVIEFEPDLRISQRRAGGYRQVQEYASGALRSGIPISQVRGILSDTVEWYVYDVRLRSGVSSATCAVEDIELVELDSITLGTPDDESAASVISFLRKHLAREESRPLTAANIAGDLGLESDSYAAHRQAVAELVVAARESNLSARLATDLWSQFVDYLEGGTEGFRVEPFVDEAYIAILARLLAADVLLGRGQLSSDEELANILDGVYFERSFQLHNMVERDYFAWLWLPEYVGELLPVARSIQRDLYAYDFETVLDEDIFGRLMVQLSSRSDRKLLGQEWTPKWVATALANSCLDKCELEEPTRIVDMCCGSGSIIAEVLKAVKARKPTLTFRQLGDSATGFDVDPLAVLLAKTTWVITLAKEVREANEPITIPIYHADSLFAVTPITKDVPLSGHEGDVVVDLDQVQIAIPSALISPIFVHVFDDVVDWAYDEARQCQVEGNANQITADRANELLKALIEKHHVTAEESLFVRLAEAVHTLTLRMAELAIANRNGIWAFILRNTYRPGLLAGQFTGLVSNPPWLAMSQLADNPYKEQLSARAQHYGVKPSGAAHLHLELATTHLLHAIDRYLKPGAGVACLVPGTILKGQHHSKFREAAYLNAERPVPFEVKEIWDIAPGTFRVRCAAVIGVKREANGGISDNAIGGAIVSEQGHESSSFSRRSLGRRTAWVIGDAESAGGSGSDDIPPQGADLMPRPAVCIEVLSKSGREWRVKTPSAGDPNYFSVKDAKKLVGSNFAGYVAPEFVYLMLQSLNVLPFIVDGNLATIAIPALRNEDGEWEILDAAAIRTKGYSQTARRFEAIDAAMLADKVVKPLREKINERNKLSQQVLPSEGYLVVNGAGGGIACSACLSLRDWRNLVIDQTLYWRVVPSRSEAWFRVGLMNSDALTRATQAFNPEGEFGERHLHTLPNRLVPEFDQENAAHISVSDSAEQLNLLATELLTSDPQIADSEKSLSSRRRRLRDKLSATEPFKTLETASAICLEL